MIANLALEDRNFLWFWLFLPLRYDSSVNVTSWPFIVSVYNTLQLVSLICMTGLGRLDGGATLPPLASSLLLFSPTVDSLSLLSPAFFRRPLLLEPNPQISEVF